MNFPGLEPGWNGFHRTLKAAGVIRPWDLATARQVVQGGASILVVANTALGDSLLTTPLVKSLADALGPDRVTFLVREPFRELYENTPWIGRVLTVPGKFRGLGELKRQLSARPCQIAMIANCTEPDVVPWLWWCGVRGFLRYRSRWSVWADWFANREMMKPPGDPAAAVGHAIDNNLAMAEALGLPVFGRRMLVHLEPTPPPEPGPPLVLIHPGASRAGKCWPLPNWAAVAGALSTEFACRFALTGARSEWNSNEELRALMPASTENLAGKLSLPELAKKQRTSALFLSGDTGPYHLALAVDCPTVTLFAPRNRGSSVEACGPHLADPKRHRVWQTTGYNAPIETIPVPSVLAAARELFRLTRPG